MSVPSHRPLTLATVRELQYQPEEALEQLGPLLITLASDDEELRAWVSDVLQILERIPAETAQLLSLYCRHAHAAVAAWACKLFGRIDSITAEHQTIVAEVMLNHPEQGVKQAAATCLGNMGPLCPEAKLQLEQVATCEHPRLSRLAQRALQEQAAA